MITYKPSNASKVGNIKQNVPLVSKNSKDLSSTDVLILTDEGYQPVVECENRKVNIINSKGVLLGERLCPFAARYFNIFV